MKLDEFFLPRRIVGFFGILCSVESLACFIWLANIPSGSDHGYFSPQRLILLGFIIFVGLFFLVLSGLLWRKPEIYGRFIHSPQFSTWLGWAHFIFGVGSFFLLCLLIFPPPVLLSSRFLAIYQRITPLIILGVLYQAQGFVVITLLARQVVSAWNVSVVKRIRTFASSRVIGYGLLGLSVLVAITQVFFVYYNLGDEGDTFTVGWLISKGWVLYQDIFSHHFPLPYLWVAWVVKLFGVAVLPVRLSLIFLRTLIFGLAMKFSRYWLTLGVTALSWGLIGYLYLGNAVVYHSFSGIFLVSSVAIGLSVMNETQAAKKSALFVLGIFCGLASLSDPLKFLPATALMMFVVLATMCQSPRQTRFFQSGMNGLTLLAGFSLSIGGYLFYGVLTNSLTDFYQNAILFNTTIYSKYSAPITLTSLSQVLTSGLDITNPLWRVSFSPYYDWGGFEFFDGWIFSGFFYRFAILAICAVFLIHRKVLMSLAVYFVASLTMVRGNAFFHASPFVLLSFFISALLISGEVFSLQKVSTNIFSGVLRTIPTTMSVIVAIMFTWLNIRGAEALYEKPGRLTYERNFDSQIRPYYRQFTCQRDDTRLLVYPIDPIIYFLTEIPPASKYLFMTPWTAEIGQEDAIKSLSEQPVIVYFDRGFVLWNNYLAEDYLSDFSAYIDQHYLPTDDEGIYLSPQLLPCP